MNNVIETNTRTLPSPTEQIRKIRSTPNLVKIVDTYVKREEQIAADQFTADKTRALHDDNVAMAIESILEQVHLNNEQLDTVRKSELEEINKKEEQSRQLPLRGSMQSETEYQTQIVKINVEATRSLEQVGTARGEAAAAAQSSDLDDLAQLFDDAFASGHNARRHLVGLAVKNRLAALEKEAPQAGAHPQVIARISKLKEKVTGLMKDWRDTEKANSPEAARQSVRKDYEIQEIEMRTKAENTARALGIWDQFQQRMGGSRRTE